MSASQRSSKEDLSPSFAVKSRGFTLIELLVVMALVGVLASLTLAALSGAQTKSARDRAATEVVALANAIERYKTQNDMYPPPSGTNLRFSDISMYMPASPGAVSGESLLDPFGNPYRYRTGNVPGQINMATFDVWSGGPDSDATNDDIGNW